MSPSEKPGRPSTLELGSQPPVTRRGFLTSTLACAVLGGPTIARHLRQTPRAESQTGLTPDAALRELVAGNARFVAEHLTSTDHDLQILRSHTADKQEPFAGVLACADSRVPVELIFDQSIGRVFVTRVAGNIVTPEIIASLEYAVAVLGIRALLVLGHSGCGAIKAAMKAETVPGQISSLYPYLRGAVQQSGGNISKAIDANARAQAELLRTSSTVIRDAASKGGIKVTAGIYDLGTGKVTLA
ncbi:MAG TPA: carbonic anhydrase [Gemmatimonadaceae bacterium]|jgi:carbonic anhydrase|nr:carbonic anhydrase [Gemmatimonadaceae bacterium]